MFVCGGGGGGGGSLCVYAGVSVQRRETGAV